MVEVREEERDGYTRSGPSRRDPRDDSRNNNDLERDLKRLQDQMDRMTREKDMANAVIENSKLMAEVVSNSKRDREDEGKKDKPDPLKLEVWSEEVE